MQDVHQLATEARDAGVLLRQADDYFVGKREAAKNASSLTELAAMITQLLTYKDNICRRMEVMAASHQERITPVLSLIHIEMCIRDRWTPSSTLPTSRCWVAAVWTAANRLRSR